MRHAALLPTMIRTFRTSWKSLLVADLLFEIVRFVVLTPVVGLLFRLFLTLSGRDVLADADIARFLLHPLGWAAAVIVGGAIVGIAALEQSTLMTVVLQSAHTPQVRALPALQFSIRRATAVFHLTALLAGRLLLVAAPFLAVGGGLYLALLTAHDINFYLAERPPTFWLAAGLIGVVLAAMTVMLVRLIAGWGLALPLTLYENVPPNSALTASRERVADRRTRVVLAVVVWFAANALLSATATAAVAWCGHLIVSAMMGNVVSLVLAVGLVLALWFAVDFATTFIAAATLAIVVTRLYTDFGTGDAFQLPSAEPAASRVRLTPWRITAGLVIAVVTAALLGVGAVQTLRLDDDVEITAHRGASGSAPENTLASVRAAIEQGADWVEIDVQETEDGVVVVAHDSDLMKVAGVPTRIWDATADELRTIDIGSYFAPEFRDERVPTLAEVLETCRGRVRLNIELKYYGHDQDLERRVVELVEQHDMTRDVVIMSLESAGIRKVKALRPDWTVGLLTAVAAGDLTRAEADFYAVNSSLATRRFITAAHSKDKRVFVWTVNDPTTMSIMIGRGADNLITDHPALARQVLADCAALTPMERLLAELGYLLGNAPISSGDVDRP